MGPNPYPALQWWLQDDKGQTRQGKQAQEMDNVSWATDKFFLSCFFFFLLTMFVGTT